MFAARCDMESVTIDNLGIKVHERWAQDQSVYDPSLIKDAPYVAMQPEVNGYSLIYSSKLEELFEMQKRNQAWASFVPPHRFQLFNKRYFSYRLFLNIHWEEEKDKDLEDDSEEQEESSENLLSEVKKLQSFTSQSSTLFEKDKTSILNLLESIQWINGMLGQICARKIQYQKG